MKALKIASKVAAVVNTEYKYFDGGASAAALSNAGIYYALCNPPQGITAITRNGDSIKVKTLTIRGLLQLTGALAEETRVVIYWDNENTVNTGTQLLSNAGSALVTMSTKQEDYRYQTKVLYDQTFKMTANYPLHKFEKTIKIDRHVHWVQNTTNIKNGCLCMMVFAQNAANTAFSFISRTSYVDN